MGARTDMIYGLSRALARLGLALVAAGWLWPVPALAAGQAICERAGVIAAQEHGIPAAVLRAITRTETGRARHGRLSSWPWTANVAGKGYWFDNRDEALRFLREQVATGQRNFDVGCFQVNYRWHRHGFASLDTMIDPMVNARYAARFLGELYGEKGNWSDAVGAYHSRTPEHARRYLKTYKVHFAAVTAGGEDATTPQIADPMMMTREREPERARVNTYPLFVSATSGTPARGGSLVAASIAGGGRPFLSMPGMAGRGAAE
ncbi:lytic transglycosylase domain-containing protein [Aquicoccus porphyridii]|uniref:Lytic transglycosylase domain-containing protein n=1 Tax=Aquicoccus porphyridii TaxID=1852029 RepID=A0A5A9YXR4_9RHOB|nr:transglycosylase SLT domain-containing protein [Aquicoccus porphyridii]KAA0909638.1 lytic transglycosylase domain-containing protein [Aquicoccus porphyridii]RAI54474.1 lytic transglycosylase domain-containing protein [Rhodobacteraceae bacterium AsT-22]